MKLHRSCALEILARGLAVLLMEDGFMSAWTLLLRLLRGNAEVPPEPLTNEDAHELANRLVACGEAAGEGWREPCAALARQVRLAFGGDTIDYARALIEVQGLAALYPGPIVERSGTPEDA